MSNIIIAPADPKWSGKAPAGIGLLSKSHYAAENEARAVEAACHSARFTDIPLPILHERKHLGYTLGRQCCDEVLYLPARQGVDRLVAAGIPTYDALINAITTSGRRYTATWSKGHTSAPVALNWYDTWPVAGNPAAGTYAGSASASIQLTDASTGSLAHFGNVSALTKHLISISAMFTAGATPPTIWLYDRCVHYGQVPFNAAALNTFTQTNTPTSLRYSTNSDSGCKIMVTGQTVTGATQSQITTLGYTNQAGTASQVAPCSSTTTNIIVSLAAPTATLGARIGAPCTTAAGTQITGPWMPMATGDVGCQLIKNLTTSAADTGTLCFVMARPLAILPLATLGAVSEKDLVMMVAGMERVFDGACLSFIVYFPVATAATLTGNVDMAWN